MLTLAVVCVAGCGASSEPAPEATACVTGCAAPWEPAPEAVQIGTAYSFNLYTHCGADEAKFAGAYWEADPTEIRSDSSPPGWSDPYQAGVMTKVSDTSAVFEAKGKQKRFQLRPGATEFLRICM